MMNDINSIGSGFNNRDFALLRPLLGYFKKKGDRFMPKQDLNELSFAEEIFNLLKEKCEKDELISSALKQKLYRSHMYPDFFSQQPNEYSWKIVLDDNKQFLILGKSKEEAEQPPEKKRKLNRSEE